MSAAEKAAEVLAEHGISAFNGAQVACRCDGLWRSNANYRRHLANGLVAAGLLAEPADQDQRRVLRGLPDEWEHIAAATLPHTEVDRQRAQVWRQCADELRRALPADQDQRERALREAAAVLHEAAEVAADRAEHARTRDLRSIYRHYRSAFMDGAEAVLRLIDEPSPSP